MSGPSPVARVSGPPQTVVELIGDADARMGEILAETLARIEDDEGRVLIRLERLGLIHADGLDALVDALRTQTLRLQGRLFASGRPRVQAWLRARGIRSVAADEASDGPPSRHVILARHNAATQRRVQPAGAA